MSLIRIRNLLHENAPKTRLSNAEVSGTTTLRVENTVGLTTGWGVQIGETGEEQTEVLIGTNSTGTQITCPATVYEHASDTPLYFVKYDQVVFERSTSGTGGTATPIASGTIAYQPNDPFTVFDDTSGSSTYGYRTYFRNSALAVNSTESDWITFAGAIFYSLAALRSRGKNKLWNADYVTDEVGNDWVNECKDMMVNKVIQVNEDYSLGTVNVGFGTDGLGTITTGDFNQLRRVWVTYNGVDKFQSTKMNVNDFFPTQTFSSSHPYHFFRGDNIVGVKPSDSSGTLELVFYRFGTTMVNDTDELPVPMRPYTNIFTEYFKAQALFKDEKFSEADRATQRIGTMVDDFVSSLGARDKSGPSYVDIIEAISG